MWARRFQVCLLAVAAVLACKAEKRADGPIVPTREMSQALTRDVRVSDSELTALQDSIYRFLGDSVSVSLKRARTGWEEYRKLECDAIRLAFTQGSIAPVAQMECWVELTDDRRRFLHDEYNFARQPGPPAMGRPR